MQNVCRKVVQRKKRAKYARPICAGQGGCGETLPREAFSQRQLDRGEERICKTCAEKWCMEQKNAMRICAGQGGCGQSLPKDGFSQTQLDKGDERLCKRCVADVKRCGKCARNMPSTCYTRCTSQTPSYMKNLKKGVATNAWRGLTQGYGPNSETTCLADAMTGQFIACDRSCHEDADCSHPAPTRGRRKGMPAETGSCPCSCCLCKLLLCCLTTSMISVLLCGIDASKDAKRSASPSRTQRTCICTYEKNNNNINNTNEQQ